MITEKMTINAIIRKLFAGMKFHNIGHPQGIFIRRLSGFKIFVKHEQY